MVSAAAGLPNDFGVEHQMRAAAGPQPDRGVDLARPHAAGIDDGTGGHVERLAGAAGRSARTEVPVASEAPTRVRIRAPCWAAVRATAVTSRASSIS